MTTYYFSSISGDDQYDGLTEKTPWRSLEKMNQAVIEPGDTILLQCGSLWRGQLLPHSGEPGKPVTYGTYGDGPRPIIQNSVEMTQESDWQATDRPNIWKSSANHAFTYDVGNIIFNHGAKPCGWKRWKLDDVKQSPDFFYCLAEQCVYLYAEANPATLYTSIEFAMNKVIVAQAGKHDVIYDGLAVRYGAGHGFGGGETKRLVIRNCDIYYIGGGHQFTTADGRPVRFGNGIEFWNCGEEHLVENNRLWEIYDAAITNQGRGQGEFQSIQRNITYRNNTIWNAEYSFEYWNNPESAITENILFEHNACFDAGYGWAHFHRPDPNGTHIMFYNNIAQTTNFVVRDNLFANSTEVCLRMTYDWRKYCQFQHNVWINKDGKNIVRLREAATGKDVYFDIDNLAEFFKG